MPYEYKLRRMVEFAETDMAGIMHFSNYFRFMEATEHAFFRSLGASVHRHAPDAMRGWARVHAECRYAEPLRYEDLVEVHLLVRERKSKVIRYDFVFRKADETTGAPVAGDLPPEEPAWIPAIRETLQASAVGRQSCVVHLNPVDRDRLAEVHFRSGTVLESDPDVPPGDVHVSTQHGLLVRDLDDTLRAVSERLQEELP